MNSNDKIKSKINALLSKTIENGATKSEMESALSKASQMMCDFFITENDLNNKKVISKCILKQVDAVKSGFDFSIFYADLANLFDCKMYYNNHKVTFFGHSQDAELCCFFYKLIVKTCLREKNFYLQSSEYNLLKNNYHGKTLSASFIKGFLVQVCYKMKDLYKSKISNIPQTYGIMILEKKEKVQSEFEDLKFSFKMVKQKPIKAAVDAFNSGKEKGKNIILTQGIDNKNNDNLNLFSVL